MRLKVHRFAGGLIAVLAISAMSHSAGASVPATEQEFLDHIAAHLPRKGAVEATYEHESLPWLHVCGFDFSTAAWYVVHVMGAGFADSNGAHYTGHGVADMRPEGRSSSLVGLRDHFPFTCLYDILRLHPTISEVVREDDGGYRAVLMLPGGQLMPPEDVPSFTRDSLMARLIRVDAEGRLIEMEYAGELRLKYEYDPRSPPGVPVRSRVIADPPGRQNEYKLVSIRWEPEGKPDLFTVEAVKALRVSVNAYESRGAGPVQPRVAGEELLKTAAQSSRPEGRRWYEAALLYFGAVIAAAGVAMIIRRRLKAG